MSRIRIMGIIVLLCACTGVQAQEDKPFVFASAPRGNAASESEVYQPVADYLSKVMGHKVVYKFSDNWMEYQQNMLDDRFDIVFDGPHFVSWRIAHLNHVPLVKLPQPHVWVVISRSDNVAVTNMGSLAGRAVCTPAPPNFGTLTLLSLFPNPSRQPFIVQTKGWRNGYDGVVANKCMAAIMPLSNWRAFDPDSRQTKLLYRHQPYPNQAITVSGRRIPPAMQATLRAALLSEAGQQATQRLRERYAKVKGQVEQLVAANPEEYANVDVVFKNVLGFDPSLVQR
jgi:ABC-type phosphate/phosphonate transport system substrate-binding protein